MIRRALGLVASVLLVVVIARVVWPTVPGDVREFVCGAVPPVVCSTVVSDL